MVGAITENIALLALLGSKLEPPKSNPVPHAMQHNAGAQRRLLSFKRELGISEAFSILLCMTDDPNRVGAVCVEETGQGSGLLLLTAVNSGSQKERVEAFHRINSVLADISAEGQRRLISWRPLLNYLQMSFTTG